MCGIYVVMFLEILRTLVRAIIVFSILIVAFGMAFYILLATEVMLDELGDILCNSCEIRNNMNKQYKYTRISIQKKMTRKKSGKNLLECIHHRLKQNLKKRTQPK